MTSIKSNNGTLIVVANLLHSFPRIPYILLPLAECGWKVTIITSKLPNGFLNDILGERIIPSSFHIVETAPYSDAYERIRRFMKWIRIANPAQTRDFRGSLKATVRNNKLNNYLINWGLIFFQSFFAFPDTEKAWIPLASDTLEKIAAKHKTFILLSSSPYPTSHIIASKFADKSGVTWIADFRDPWSNNPNYKMFFWRQFIDRLFEKKILKKARLITTVSKNFFEKLSEVHGQDIKIIPNGYIAFDDDQEADVPTKVLNIAYTGRWYPGKQNINILLNALTIIREKGLDHLKHYQVTFSGPVEPEFQYEVESRNLENYVSHTGPLQFSVVRKMQKSSDLLFAMGWEDSPKGGLITLKFLEYLSTKKNIVLTSSVPDKPLLKILEDTKCGKWFRTSEELAEHLVWARQMKSERKTIPFYGINAEIEKFSFEVMSQKLECILELLLHDQ